MIREFCLWIYNESPAAIVKQVYGLEEKDGTHTSYLQGKMRVIQDRPISWFLDLDLYHTAKVEELIKLKTAYRNGR